TPTATPTPTPTPSPGICPNTITQSVSQAIVSGVSIYCSLSEGSYWRAFNMQTFTGGQQYNVISVSFGIELAVSASGTGQPFTGRLYANHGQPFPSGDWQNHVLVEQELNVTDQALTLLTVPLVTTVPLGTLELVMEVFTPQLPGNYFVIGSNPYGQTGPIYGS